MEIVITVNLEDIQVRAVGGAENLADALRSAVMLALSQYSTHRVTLDYEVETEIKQD